MHFKSNALVPVALTLGILTTAFVAAGSTLATTESAEGAGGGPLTEPKPTTSIQTAVNSVTNATTTAAAGGFTDASTDER